jgi:hypothetical protein
MSDSPIRETTLEERATWGTCPVCKAEHGQKCNPEVGIPLGRTVSGEPPQDGAHLGRLNRAPSRVQLTPVP